MQTKEVDDAAVGVERRLFVTGGRREPAEHREEHVADPGGNRFLCGFGWVCRERPNWCPVGAAHLGQRTCRVDELRAVSDGRGLRTAGDTVGADGVIADSTTRSQIAATIEAVLDADLATFRDIGRADSIE
ncbi:MAG: hypothetical protein ACXVXO_15715 [Mycobacteriaceae bacterium]